MIYPAAEAWNLAMKAPLHGPATNNGCIITQNPTHRPLIYLGVTGYKFVCYIQMTSQRCTAVGHAAPHTFSLVSSRLSQRLTNHFKLRYRYTEGHKCSLPRVLRAFIISIITEKSYLWMPILFWIDIGQACTRHIQMLIYVTSVKWAMCQVAFSEAETVV